MPDLIRPAVAATRFGVSERTLARWAASGLVGRAQVGGMTWLCASDIADVIAARLVVRTIVPMVARPDPEPRTWGAHALWGTRGSDGFAAQTKKTGVGL